MIENQIQNLLCLKIILEYGTPHKPLLMVDEAQVHTDDYKEELCLRYLGFIPDKEKIEKFEDSMQRELHSVKYSTCLWQITVSSIIEKYEKFIGNLLDIKCSPPKNTHPNALRYTKDLIDNMDKVLLRDLKLRYVIQ
jgi:hypothetical protein